MIAKHPITTIENINQDIINSSALPNNCYNSPEFFEYEKRNLWCKNWVAVAFSKDLPENSFGYPINFLDIPILLIRDKNGMVNAFHNVCRHRGMILVKQAGKLHQLITCPYHAWSYHQDGRLKKTPHIGGVNCHTHDSVDPSNLGLYRINVYEWLGVIFINIDNNAPDFPTQHQHIMNRWQEFNQPLFYSGDEALMEFHLKANWKLAVENYCESYHLPFVHPSLNSYSRIEDHYHINEFNLYSGQGSYVYNPTTKNGKTLPNFNNLDQKWYQGTAEYICLYPNVLLGVHRDHIFAIILEPLAYNELKEHVCIYFASKTALDGDYQTLRHECCTLWHDVFLEDVDVVEGMQIGRKVPIFDGGKFSPVMDNATHCFHHWAAQIYHS